MRSRTFILLSLLTATLTGLLFYTFQKQSFFLNRENKPSIDKNVNQVPARPSGFSKGCVIENNIQYKNLNLTNGQKYTLAEADNLLKEGTKQYTEKYKYDDALKNFKIALKVYKKEKNFDKEAITLGRIGTVYYETADYKKAIDCHEERRKISIAKNNKKEEMAALSSLGNAYYAMGNYPKARVYFSRSLKIAQKTIMDKRAEAIALGGLGSVYHSLGNYTKAIENHKHRLNIIDEALKNNQELTEIDQKEFMKLKGAALGSLGNAYQTQGDNKNAPQNEKDYEQAMQYFEEHLQISEDPKYKDRREQALALGELGSAYHSRWKRSNFSRKDDLDKAIEFYEKRLTIAQGIGDLGDRRLVASTYGGLGNIYYSTANLEKKNPEKSKEDYEKAIKYTDDYLITSRAIQDIPGMGNALNILGVSYFQISSILKKQGKSTEAQINLAQAIEKLTKAIEVRESLRERLTETEKILIFDTQQTTYLNLQQVYVSDEKYDLALEIAERGRAKAFVDVLAKQLNMNREASTTFSIQDIKRIAQEQQATLVIYSNILEKNSITNHSEKIYIWVVRPNEQPVSFEQVDLKDLKDRKVQKETLSKIIQKFQQLEVNGRPGGIVGVSLPRIYIRGNKRDIILGNKTNKDDLKTLLAIYYDLLMVKKNNQQLLSEEDKKVIFIPQGSLFELPFAALYDNKAKQYLIEKHTILTSPSVHALDMLHKRQQKRDLNNKSLQNKDWLILGIAEAKPKKLCSQDAELNKIPGAEQEAKDIASVLFQGKAMEDRTEAAVRQKMPHVRMIHLATHGLLSSSLNNCKEDVKDQGEDTLNAPDDEVPGAIALNASENDDGWLTASEISQMKLQAELMVLSACDTARGRLTADGVIGLSRSALAAGSSSAIVSLWQVEDYSTAFLMKEFYTQLKEQQSKLGKLDKAEALRQAMLKTKNYVDKNTNKKIYSEPYQWSAFTLVGEATTQLENHQ